MRLATSVLVTIALCSALSASVYTESFDTNDGGYTVSGTASWAWGEITSGPGAAHSGAKAWATNPAGNYENEENGYLTSPEIDLSSHADKAIVLTWWQYLTTESGADFGWVEVTNNGGATWAAVCPERSGDVSLLWLQQTAVLDNDYAVANFRVRFRLRSDLSHTRSGFYVDDVAVDAVSSVSVYSETFDTDNGGFTSSGTTSWQWGQPTAEPDAAHSSPNVWATNLAGFYSPNENGYVVSPVMDASSQNGGSETLVLSWWQHLRTEGGADLATVQASVDGVSWQAVYGPASGDVSSVWTRQSAVLDDAYAVSALRVRFGLTSDASLNNTGFAIDDVALDRLDADISSGDEAIAFTVRLSGALPGTLRFGILGDATDGFNTGVDSASTASGDTVAYFAAPDGQTPDKLDADFRGPATVTRWDLVVEAPAQRSDVTLSWDAGAVQAGRLLYLQQVRSDMPDGPPLDMSVAGQTTVTASTTFEIAYGDSEQTTIPFEPGWNMIGLGLMTTQSADTVFGSHLAAPVGWYWDGTYRRLDTDTPLNAERGYWLLFDDQAQSNTVTGISADGAMELQPGWNLVTPVQALDLSTHAEIADPAWSWNAASDVYVQTPKSSLQAGITYWVSVTGAPPVSVP